MRRHFKTEIKRVYMKIVNYNSVRLVNCHIQKSNFQENSFPTLTCSLTNLDLSKWED